MSEQDYVLLRDAPGDPGQFVVYRNEEESRKITLPTPYGFHVEGRPDSDLMAELRWYLEQFLEYPFPPQTVRAERALTALGLWSERVADSIRIGEVNAATLRLVSDEPERLSWPWEALAIPSLGAHHFRSIQREPQSKGCCQPRSGNRLNILLIIARPFPNDVGYLAIARPILQALQQHRSRATVYVLRPPTFEALRQRLKDYPDFYDVLHFDGHGRSASGIQNVCAPTSELVFESEKLGLERVSADRIAELISRYPIPQVIINACQSSMLDPNAEGAFSSVATALTQAGTTGVLAMSYALCVSGARQFFPDFYKTLITTGNMALAVEHGRAAMSIRKERSCSAGIVQLSDSLVPTFYSNARGECLDRSFFQDRAPDAESEGGLSCLDPKLITGRDGLILTLERILGRSERIIVIHGLAGIGKRTLIRAFLGWRAATAALAESTLWLGFNDFESMSTLTGAVQAVENRLGTHIAAIDNLKTFVDYVERYTFVVIDRIDASVILDQNGKGELTPETGLGLLSWLLNTIGATGPKFVLLARARIAFTSLPCVQIRLEGLERAERWEYIASRCSPESSLIRSSDPSLSELIDRLDGHPTLMNALLPLASRLIPERLVKVFDESITELRDVMDPEAASSLFEPLQSAVSALSSRLKSLLEGLALYRVMVGFSTFNPLVKNVDPSYTDREIRSFLVSLCNAGVLAEVNADLYKLHPALPGYLHPGLSGSNRKAQWEHSFAVAYASLADFLGPKSAEEQKLAASLESTNMRRALKVSATINIPDAMWSLEQRLSLWTENAHGPVAALAEYSGAPSYQNPAAKAARHYRVGALARRAGDLIRAEEEFRRALAIVPETWLPKDSALLRLMLGRTLTEKGILDEAETLCREALEISESESDPKGKTGAYLQLGTIEFERASYINADQLYDKGISAAQSVNDDVAICKLLYQKGRVAEQLQDLDSACTLIEKSADLAGFTNNQESLSLALHHLGWLAECHQDTTRAEQRYLEALQIKERRNDMASAAITYGALLRLARDRRDATAALTWFEKARPVLEATQNWSALLILCWNAGAALAKEGGYLGAGKLLVRALQLARTAPFGRVADLVKDFLYVFHSATPDEKDQLKRVWEGENIGEFPRYTVMDLNSVDDPTIYSVLARVAQARQHSLPEPVAYTPELRSALLRYLDIGRDELASLHSGDLARTALELFAADRNDLRWIEQAMTQSSSSPDHYAGPAEFSLVAGAIIALRSTIEIEVGPKGWSFKWKVNPIEASALKPLIVKLVALLPQ